jgi:hypothetical protein
MVIIFYDVFGVIEMEVDELSLHFAWKLVMTQLLMNQK